MTAKIEFLEELSEENDIFYVIRLKSEKIDKWPVPGHFLLASIDRSVHVSTATNRKILLRPGEMVFLRSGCALSVRVPGHAKLLFVRFDPLSPANVRFLSALSDRTKDLSPLEYGCGKVSLSPPIREFLKSVDDMKRSGCIFESVERKLYEVLLGAMNNTFGYECLAPVFFPVAHPDSEFIARVYDYISDCAGVTKDLPVKMNLSYDGFYKKFVRIFGVSPKEFQQKLRAEEVRADLNMEMTVAEVKRKHGFKSDNAFRSFCEKYLCETMD